MHAPPKPTNIETLSDPKTLEQYGTSPMPTAYNNRESSIHSTAPLIPPPFPSPPLPNFLQDLPRVRTNTPPLVFLSLLLPHLTPF